MVRVSLYGKDDCHLCDEAKAVLDAARRQVPFDLEVVDITHDPALFDRYRYDIPVIHVNGRKAFKHRLDPAAVLARLRRAEGEPS
jgi:glutaredoxin